MESRHLSRGKRIDNGEWVYGAVLFHDSDAATIFNQHPADGSLQGFEVNIKTICQCTGLYDKNGTLIWENDIVHVKHTDGQDAYQEIAKVSYSKHGFSPFSWEYECDGCDLRCEILEIEVRGNKFDNPELLEV